MSKTKKLEGQAARLSQLMPPGTSVKFWPGSKAGPSQAGVVKCDFSVIGGHTVVGWLHGAKGCVAASHIERA